MFNEINKILTSSNMRVFTKYIVILLNFYAFVFSSYYLCFYVIYVIYVFIIISSVTFNSIDYKL